MWKKNYIQADIAQKWSRHPLADTYARVQSFLQDEQQVRAALATLNTRTEKFFLKLQFQTHILDYLKQRGFNGVTVTARGWLPPSEFLRIVENKQLIMDIGAGTRHGHVTHWVQWVLIGIHDESAGVEGIASAEYNLGRVYSGIGSKMARDATDPAKNLWNDLLDKGKEQDDGNDCGTACSPEFLHDVLARASFPHLFRIWA